MHSPVGYYNLYNLINNEVVKRKGKKKDIAIIHVHMNGVSQVPYTGHTNNMCRDCAAQRSSLRPLVKPMEEENVS